MRIVYIGIMRDVDAPEKDKTIEWCKLLIWTHSYSCGDGLCMDKIIGIYNGHCVYNGHCGYILKFSSADLYEMCLQVYEFITGG